MKSGFAIKQDYEDKSKANNNDKAFSGFKNYEEKELRN